MLKRRSAILDGYSAVLVVVIYLYVVLAPYTKVEESFNLQAVHDLLFHGSDLAAYDHHTFPGVVPRTFLGPVVVALLSAGPCKILAAAGMPKVAGLYCARLVLGTLVAAALLRMRAAVQRLLGPPAGAAFVSITALQFHLPFYASRTLPNVFALAAASLAHADWLEGSRPLRAIALLAFTTVVFRCDLLPWAGVVGLHLLATRQVSLVAGVGAGAAAVAASLALTVPLDSLLWGRWLWPEGEVLWFNTAQNRSSEWGVMPLHWYWSSALPRALLGGLPLACLGGLLERRVRPLLACLAAYISAYSLLPHKEVRFLFPVLPLFNVAAAAGLVRACQNRRKSAAWAALCCAAVAALGATLAATALMTAVSRHNYPGGDALRRLHALEAGRAKQALAQGRNLTVHIGVAAAMTGVSRFCEAGQPWVYSKVEDLDPQALLARNFDYMVSAEPQLQGCDVIGSAKGYKGLQLKLRPQELLQCAKEGRAPLAILLEPQIYIHTCTDAVS